MNPARPTRRVHAPQSTTDVAGGMSTEFPIEVLPLDLHNRLQPSTHRLPKMVLRSCGSKKSSLRLRGARSNDDPVVDTSADQRKFERGPRGKRYLKGRVPRVCSVRLALYALGATTAWVAAVLHAGGVRVR